MNTAATNRPIRVFVHLARGFGAAQWQAKWDRGQIIGLNERLPYGYFWAQQDGCAIEYSEDRGEGWPGWALRLGFRLVLGFDFVHAWRNRRAIYNAEIIWTHTESQYLAVLLLLRGRARANRAAPPLRRGRDRANRPKVIAQSVWLFDEWPRLSRLRRWLYAKLIADAAVLTVLSPENLKVARALFPRQRSEMIPYGIKADRMAQRPARAAHRPVRVPSLGSDRHRDWPTLVAAVANLPDYSLHIAAPRLDRKLMRSANVMLVHPKSNNELAALYDWADLVALALTPNLHASGITVVEEATVFGLPVVCTRTGGLDAYFSEGEVRYVPVGQPAPLREAIAGLAANDGERELMVERARRRITQAGLTSRRYSQRHAELSHELLRGSAAKKPMEARKRHWPARLALRGAMVLGGLLSGIIPVTTGARALTAGLDLCRFHPTFTEDFNTLSVSPWGETASRWIAHTPWNGDFGDAAFVDPKPDFPFRVSDGNLDVEARKGADGKWQSGLLASATPTGSGFSQRYGYFEMRAELPSGPGVWPAFWLNSNQPKGDKQPGVEIDVIEYYGQFPDAYHSAVHVWDKVDPKQSRELDHVTSVPSGTLSSGFHTFGVDVEPDWITFYLDRHETWRVATPSELHDPLMVLVDLALGSGWPIDHTPNPSIMKVNYVHVFAPPTAGATAVSGGCDDR